MKKTYQIKFEWDIVHMRSEVRELAKQMGFNELDQARIVQAVSELARNVIQHAEEGEIQIETVEENKQKGLRFLVEDFKSGGTNINELIKQVKNRSNEKTSGLQQVYLLMDGFNIKKMANGVSVEATKWLKLE